MAARLRQRMQSYNRESRRTSKDDCASGRRNVNDFVAMDPGIVKALPLPVLTR